MRVIALILLMLLVSCGRPLTPAETAFLTAFHGDGLDTSRIRMVDGAPLRSVTLTIPPRPRLTCQERLNPPRTEPVTITTGPAAMVIHNTILMNPDIYTDDMLPAWPDRLSLPHAMLLAHEATHVWQWQNRKLTGYHPLKAAREHRRSPDPYLFDPDNTLAFLDYGYEQQGAIVEEYLCCALLDPEAPRTARLRDMLRPHFTLADLPITALLLPWDGVQPQGICRPAD